MKPLASKSKPSEITWTFFFLNQNLLQRIMFPTCFLIYCIYDFTDHVQKPTIPVSGGIVSKTWENIPSNLTSIHPHSFLLLQHKPSQENNKQMSRMGTVLSESSQALRQAGIAALVPRLEGRGQASAWLSQSLRRTRKTWQKSLLPVTFIPQLTGCTHLLAQVWTHKLRVKQIFLHWNQQWGSAALASALCVVLSEETLHDWAL